MRKNTFSRVNRRAWTAAAVSAAFLVPLGILGGPALASSVVAAAQYEYGGSSQYQYKITICHHTHSRKHQFVQISVSVHSEHAHLRHGDTLGTCPVPPVPAPGTKHGDDGDQGNGGDHGKGGDHGNGDGQGQNGNSQGNSSGNHGNSGGDHGNSGGHGHH
jgi:uncharacterized membrane protein YgcG